MNTFALIEMKRRFKIFVELLVIVLLSVVFPKENFDRGGDSSSVQIARVEIEEQQEVERFEGKSEIQSDSIDNDGGKKGKASSSFKGIEEFSLISNHVNDHNYAVGAHSYPKSPRYILYCSLIVYA